LLFQAAPNRCVLDHSEAYLYVGLVNGLILRISIKRTVQDSNKLIEESLENGSFLGHKQKINCLAVSFDDFTLASGSDDGKVRIWDTLGRQCIKLIEHNGICSHFFNSRISTKAKVKNIFLKGRSQICFSRRELSSSTTSRI
jgi:WD40 repeat protein